MRKAKKKKKIGRERMAPKVKSFSNDDTIAKMLAIGEERDGELRDLFAKYMASDKFISSTIIKIWNDDKLTNEEVALLIFWLGIAVTLARVDVGELE